MGGALIHIARSASLWLGPLALTIGCAKILDECGGRQDIDYAALAGARQVLQASSGYRADLVLPNPMDATQSLLSLQGATNLSQYADTVPLRGLSGTTLDNALIRVRQTAVTDSPIQATNSYFQFPVQDVRYSAAMSYYAVFNAIQYLSLLGYSILTNRPLYVVVRSPENYQGEFNAFYTHNRFNPSAPRVIDMIGGGERPTAADEHMGGHEAHHYLLESITADIGVDKSSERGSRYSPAAVVHEFTGDYGALARGNQPFIGRWIAMNFSDVPQGAPLRSAIDDPNNLFDYREAALNRMDGVNPEKYVVAEGLLRAAYELRGQIQKEQTREIGAVVADDLVFGALSLSSRDTDIVEFQKNLAQADEELYCGMHQRSIQRAFESRGFLTKFPEIKSPLQVAVAPFGLQVVNNQVQVVNPRPGIEVGFEFIVQNPNPQTAYDVHIEVTSRDQFWIESTYRQGLGHIGPGKRVTVSFDNDENQPYPLSHSVYGFIDSRRPTASGLQYTITVRSQNGPITTHNGVLP